MKKWLLICCMIFLASGCGTQTENGANSNNLPLDANDNNAIGDNLDPNHQDQQQDQDQEGANNEPNDPTNPSDSDTDVNEVLETVEKRYYMNGIYDIKPINPDDDDKVVLITIDDGPKELEMVTQLLDVLDKHQAKAIFFLNGDKAKTKPELVKLIHENGQIIGSHSWDHINLKNESKEKIDQQIEDVQHFMEETIGVRPQFFRPPHGAGNDYLKEKVKAEGMLYMTWSAAAEDWKQEYRTTEAIVEHVMEQLRPGSNILLHEVQWTVEAFDTLLTKIADAGYSFVDPRTIDLGIE